GQTFTDYKGNPVLTHEGARIDTPRPFWYEPTKRWVAPIFDFFTNKDGKQLRCVGFYSSANLTDWKYESRVEQDKFGDELCGCVDFFQLAVDGNPQNKKWIMIFIDGSYIVGDFDGSKFYTLSGKSASTKDRISSLVIDDNFYATQTWENVTKDRRVQIAWMQTEEDGQYPGMPFNQQMTFPSELTLHSTKDGARLHMNPIEEIKTLRKKTHKWTDLALKLDENPLSGLKGDIFDIEVEFEPVAGSETVFELRGIEFVYNSETQTLLSCGTPMKLKPINGVICLRILLDRTSIEVYGNNGRRYLPLVAYPEEDNLSLSATCRKSQVKASYLRIHELKSIWDEKKE
ncbi:MAG: glycoside hydrolase family 32 protein, partial [Planctomycetota bacterium]